MGCSGVVLLAKNCPISASVFRVLASCNDPMERSIRGQDGSMMVKGIPP